MSDVNNRYARNVVRDSTDATIYQLLSSLDCPRSLAVWLLYSAGEHDQLVELECDARAYEHPSQFRDAYAATCLLSKANFLRTSFDRRQRALDKFRKSEEQCRETNHRLWPFSTPDYKSADELHPLISRVRSKIKVMLGRFDPEELVDSSDWGPGVSTLLKGATSVKPNKYQSETGMTSEVHSAVWPLVKVAYPTWWVNLLKDQEVSIERGNAVTTVPKNSKTDRVIAIEPGWNLWFQKGLGTMIRRRLLRWGCNLNDQTINQRLSRLAYSLGLATIDFSNASDTIAFEVVRLLFPKEWFEVLRLFRCKEGRHPDGRYAHWQKFSSMGNGYTFELESLVFYACALVCVEATTEKRREVVSVYGDDVIVPVEAVPSFLELVSLLGFTVNQQKSFTAGNFYESCGKHWFKGSDVTPFYLKDRVRTVSACFSLHNRIVEFAQRCLSGLGMDSRFKKVCRDLRSLVPKDQFCLVSQHMGDAGFYSNLDHAMSLRTTSSKRMIGWKIRISTEVAVTRDFDGFGLVLDRLRAMSLRGDFTTSQGRKTPRNAVPLKASTKRVLSYTTVGFGQWRDLGSWF